MCEVIRACPPQLLAGENIDDRTEGKLFRPWKLVEIGLNDGEKSSFLDNVSSL